MTVFEQKCVEDNVERNMEQHQGTGVCWEEVQEDGSGDIDAFKKGVDCGEDLFYRDREGRNMIMLGL